MQQQQTQQQPDLVASFTPVTPKPAPKPAPKPTRQRIPLSTGPSQTREAASPTPPLAPTPPATAPRIQGGGPNTRKHTRKNNDGNSALNAISDDDEDHVPIFQSSRPGRRSNRNSNSASANDGPYKPDRLAPDDDDDNYKDGLVPESKPDLGIAMQVAPPTAGLGRVLNSGQDQPLNTDGHSRKRQRTSRDQTSGGSPVLNSGTLVAGSGARLGTGTRSGSPPKTMVAGKTGNTAKPTLAKKSPLGQVTQVD